MKILYVLAALILIGAMLMFFSTFKLMDVVQAAKIAKLTHRPNPTLTAVHQYYVLAGYLGMTFFAVGTVGAVIVLIQLMRRW